MKHKKPNRSSETIKLLVAELESLLESAGEADYSEPYQLADDYSKAFEAIQRWAPDTANTALQVAMVLVYLHLDKVGEAESILSQYDEIAGQNFDICRYELAIAKGNLTQALEILDRLEPSQEATTTQIMTLAKRAKILLALGRVKEAKSVIDLLIDRHVTVEIAAIEAAVLYKLTDQNFKHEQIMCSEFISTEGKASVHRDVVTSYCEQEKWLLAATELKQMPGIDDNELDLLVLMNVQRKSGLDHAAGHTARKVRLLRGGIGNDSVAEIELRDYIRRGDFNGAVELLALLRANAPDNTDYICCEAAIQIRKLKNKLAAKALLVGIDLDLISHYWRSELRGCGLIPLN